MATTSNQDRTIAVDGLVNARDLGGMKRKSGGDTPFGVFFRTDNVDKVTEAGWRQAYELGIRTVVDLRQPGERATDTHERPAWLRTVHVDLDGLENTEFWADYWDNGLVGTAMYYLPHLEAMPERTGAALAAIVSAPPGGVLFHCMGGRDRTGMIAMLLLKAADVADDAIVDDYLQTVRLGAARAAGGHGENAEPMLEQLCATYGTTTEGAFRTALDGADLDRILDAAGLPDSERTLLATWRGTLPR